MWTLLYVWKYGVVGLEYGVDTLLEEYHKIVFTRDMKTKKVIAIKFTFWSFQADNSACTIAKCQNTPFHELLLEIKK